ncbi:MAG: DUF6036 family nucleotidyltransferase [Verrucomicrobiota bacterium]
MKRSEIEHVLRAAKGIAGEDEFILIGSQSVLGALPDAPLVLRRSIELDIYPKHHPEKSDLIDGAIGERSLFHETHGYYAHGVSPETAHLPAGWENRLVRISSENTGGTIGWCLDVHDLAYSKLAAGRPKDLEFVGNLLRYKLARQMRIKRLVGQEQNADIKPRLTQRLAVVVSTLRPKIRIRP